MLEKEDNMIEEQAATDMHHSNPICSSTLSVYSLLEQNN